MGSKKHKKSNKSERRERYEEFSSDHRPSSLKLILKVGNNSTPEYGDDSPAYNMQVESNVPGNELNASTSCTQRNIFGSEDCPEKHKKSKKKKKKKDREKRHKHHKEKRHRRRSSHREPENNVIEDVPMVTDAGNSSTFGLGDESSRGEEDLDFNEEDSSCTQQLQENILRYSGISAENSPANQPITKAIIPHPIEIEKSPSVSPVKDYATPAIPLGSPGSVSTTVSTPGSMTPAQLSNFTGPSTPKLLDNPKTPSSCSDSGRELRTCVMKLKQIKTPLTKLLDHLLRVIEKRDPHQFFAWPVTDDIAPGYSSIIDQPMDFLTMRQKIENNEYSTLLEFTEDFRLMCENAIRYNHVETVYHKAAKKLLHVGLKILHPESLMRSLKPASGYMRELTAKELGFEFRYGEDNTLVIDSADECASTGADENSQVQTEEDEKRKLIRLENEPKSKFEAYVDDLTSEEILAQVQSAAQFAKNKLSNRQKANQMGFLRQNKDGTTSLKILLGNDIEGSERIIKLGEIVGRLKEGTGSLQCFREDRRNQAKLVKPLAYGAFGSFAPIFDSRFSNLSKEETELVLSTYGDATSAEYAESISEFTKDSCYASILANSLLDYLTQGEHSKTIAHLYENQYQRFENNEIEKTFPDSISKDEEEYEKYKNVKIEFDKLKGLNDLGIDMSFLDGLKEELLELEIQNSVNDQITANIKLIEKLHNTQHDRLSQPLPQHLSNIQHPSNEENQLAQQITQNFVDIAKKLPPSAITEPHALRKAMGMSNVGLPPISQPTLNIPPLLQDRAQTQPQQAQAVLTACPNESSQIAMEIDDVVQATNSDNHNSAVDLESELREFLEQGGSNLTAHNIDNSIEQMLLN
ncbi:bromodomain-containing protein 7 [Condylostylus longicornis]|uniref:bromodomain-containing protein 7 n=1 Tax=Condylostylus longicornis TaxID=2530218 RepID=UPI00244DE9C6|nr:bromodomain-containing protein 7 [Condylostylus longicornis]